MYESGWEILRAASVWPQSSCRIGFRQKNANGKCILSVKWTVYLVFYFALRIRVEIIYDV